jgi:hypothetical protein
LLSRQFEKIFILIQFVLVYLYGAPGLKAQPYGGHGERDSPERRKGIGLSRICGKYEYEAYAKIHDYCEGKLIRE